MNEQKMTELPEGITPEMLKAVYATYDLECSQCVKWILDGWKSFPSHNAANRGRHAGHCTCNACW
jgi:hypothetical protein